MTLDLSAGRQTWRSRRGVGEAIVLLLLTLAFIGTYFFTKAPLYNPVGTIDPWLYTALWTNFDQIYHYFLGTYYVSRVPWIAPGYVLNLLFDHRTAYFVIHIFFFAAGAIMLYVVCRRWFGFTAAAMAYIGLCGNQMYFNDHRWDYETGGALTFVIASIAFALPRTESPPRRAVSLALAGFFSAAAATTLIVDSIYLVAGLPLLYVAAWPARKTRARLRRVAQDIAAFGSGILALIAVCGVFAHRRGGEFLFFMPQVRAVFSTNSEGFQQPVHAWFPKEPYFFFPPFVIVLGLVVLIVTPSATRATYRLLVAAVSWLAVVFVGVSLWEFAGSGFLFEYSYYFTAFLVPSLFAFAAIVATTLEPSVRRSWRRSTLAVALAATAVLAADAWVYRSDHLDQLANGLTRGAYLATLVAMVFAIALSALRRVVRSFGLAMIAAAVAFFAISYSGDASLGTADFGYSDARTGALYDLGQDLTSYLHKNGFATEMPFFWYDGAYQGGLYASLQSLYYSGYTYIGDKLPIVDDAFRSRIRTIEPKKLVLLCSEPACAGGEPALKRAGFSTRELARHRLGTERAHVWVVIRSVRPIPD
jgi:hypothetical protein